MSEHRSERSERGAERMTSSSEHRSERSERGAERMTSSSEHRSERSERGAERMASSSELAAARALLADHPIIDGHNDLPFELRQLVNYDLSAYDIGQRQSRTHTD